MKTSDYLDRLAAAFSMDGRPASDYAIAKRLGISKQAMTAYRNKGGTFGAAVALRVAQTLKIDPAAVLADMEAEKAKDEAVRKVWQRVARQIGKAASRAAVFALAAGMPAWQALGYARQYILCQIASPRMYVKFDVHAPA